MGNVIVTGAAGFTGAALVKTLIERGNTVYAVVRPGSVHNSRLKVLGGNVHVVENDMAHINELLSKIDKKCNVFFHLAWLGDRTSQEQAKNVGFVADSLKAAVALGCSRYICTGSQAEYGIVPMDEMATEDRKAAPFSEYGRAKVAACNLSRDLSEKLGIEWIWGRVFSLIGKYEPRGRMLPDLYYALKKGENYRVSSCRQNWDYLDVFDAADALVALAQMGKPGEIYNIANGNYRPLKEYIEQLRIYVGGKGKIIYGEDPTPFVSLQPSVQKIKNDTSWAPKREFIQSIYDYGD